MLRCLFLFSGGLDSILGVKILQEQKIKVIPVNFRSYFFNSQQAKEGAQNLGLKLKIVNIGEEHLKIVKNPCWGYGKNMNPCIDCHLLMLKEAKKIMEKEKYDFIATGEVLGERPMSQNKNILKMLEKKSGLEGYLLRPLSAKLLEPTILEKQKKIDREKLLDIQGRSRKRQLALAKMYKIKDYPTPAGGCLLTDPEFSRRLKELFEKWPDCSAKDIELLKFGRHFWSQKIKIVVGRNKEDNQQIKNLAESRDYLLKLKNFSGPTTLIRGEEISKSTIIKAGELTAWYSKKTRKEKEVEVLYWQRNRPPKIILVKPAKNFS